jgi:predicted PurR-regulated permease PerM
VSEGARMASERPRALIAGSAGVIVASVTVLAVFYFARAVLIPLFVAMLLAFMLAPLVSGMVRLHCPRAVGSFIAVVLLLASLYAVAALLYDRALEFADDVPRYSSKIQRMLKPFRDQARKLEQSTEAVLPTVNDGRPPLAVKQATSLHDVFIRGVGSLTEFLIAVSFIPFLVYFMLSWQEHLRAAIVGLFRVENRPKAHVALGQIAAMMRIYIAGNVVIGLGLALLSVAVFAVLRLPDFLFIGFISGLLSLVPYLGVVLALIPPVLVTAGQMSGAVLAAVVATVLALHLLAWNILYPKVIGRRVQLNPLAVTIALLLWGWIWGGIGLILAIPLTAAVKIVCDHVERLRPYAGLLGEGDQAS